MATDPAAACEQGCNPPAWIAFGCPAHDSLTAGAPDAASVRDDRDEERWERINRALTWVPTSHYDEVTKIARYAVAEFVAERDRYREALEHIAGLPHISASAGRRADYLAKEALDADA